jgi:phosphopentomutase
MALADKHLVEIARARAQRLEARAAGTRSVIVAMMQGLHLPKLQRPLSTLTISHTTTAKVTDQDELPAEYMRSAPDMHAIRKALTAGTEVPGASLNNPMATLTIRTK